MGVQEQEQLWGGETTKAVANFPVSGERIPVPVVRWLGRIKSASAHVNAELGLLDEEGRAGATDEHETLECGLVFRSVGYRGVELPGVPFDAKGGVIPNEDGRVAPGVYAAGWIKRGPTGVIGTNKKDATETVELLLEDLRDAARKDRPPDELETLLADRGVRYVLYAGWTSIDELERAAGEKVGRPRVKLVTWDDMLDTAERVASSGV